MLIASVVVVSWNGEAFLESCLHALTSQTLSADRYEVIVVDNGSTDQSVKLVRQRFPAIKVIEAGQNLGYAGGANLGWLHASGRVLALLNQDTVPRRDWLSALVTALDDPTVGIAGSKILDPDGRTLQHAGAHLDWPLVEGLHYGRGELDAGQYNKAQEVEFVTGAALAARKAVLERVGFMDEGFFPGYFEDADLCLRIRKAGYRVLFIPQATVLHQESASFEQLSIGKGAIVYRSRLRFILKNYAPVQIANEFVPAEISRLPSLGEEQLRALVLACTQAQIMWPSLSRTLPTRASHDEVIEVVRALGRLHDEVALQQLGTFRP
jgi:GT2 family glycosyltransferase